jgi:hypothetical protein
MASDRIALTRDFVTEREVRELVHTSLPSNGGKVDDEERVPTFVPYRGQKWALGRALCIRRYTAAYRSITRKHMGTVSYAELGPDRA